MSFSWCTNKHVKLSIIVKVAESKALSKPVIVFIGFESNLIEAVSKLYPCTPPW